MGGWTSGLSVETDQASHPYGDSLWQVKLSLVPQSETDTKHFIYNPSRVIKKDFFEGLLNPPEHMPQINSN